MDLGALEWTLIGWIPNTWAIRQDIHNLDNQNQITEPIPAEVPGAVQDDLRRAGLIPDWNVGLKSYACEWVENRHWEYRAVLEVPASWDGKRIMLSAEGLDHSGWILIDGVIAAEFEGMLIPHAFDLTDKVEAGRQYVISIMFAETPPEQGQFGYTSRSEHYKARFAYQWDWCPRMVPIGIWDTLRLEAWEQVKITGCLPRMRYEAESGRGMGNVRIRTDASAETFGIFTVALSDSDGKKIMKADLDAVLVKETGDFMLDLPDVEDVDPWWPNGEGEQTLYALEITLKDEKGAELDTWCGKIGFKQVSWLPNEGAPASAEPWICSVNGRPIFLFGVNWVPSRMTYGTETPEQIRERLKLYAGAGMNIIRIWGGAVLGSEALFEACDEMGIMVWQEFPLSSSGVDNMPPSDPKSVFRLVEIAESYVWRRGGHASMLVWSGGNELLHPDFRPVNRTHPAISRMAGAAAQLTPDVRFVSTSPTGPRFGANPDDFGKGVHHDVHGPWRPPGTMEEWQAFWDEHDGLFISEVGTPGASPAEMIERFKGDQDMWPPNHDNPYWRHRGAWWIQWDRLSEVGDFSKEKPELARYVEMSQDFQARALSYALRSCANRFPSCGGFVIWMGHDCFPCNSNTALIDFDAKPKPVLSTLAKVFEQNKPRG
jgi:beta-mannosidase